MLKIKDICRAFFEGYIYAKATELLLNSKIIYTVAKIWKDTSSVVTFMDAYKK